MCNQVTNLIQWKNLTDEQKAGYDFENYRYEMQDGDKWRELLKSFVIFGTVHKDTVYRLVIQPEKFYMMSHKDHIEQFCLRGADVTSVDEMIISIRPATEAEIPEPERVFKDGAHYAYLYRGRECTGKYRAALSEINGLPVDCPDISWIGEELTIEWGKK